MIALGSDHGGYQLKEHIKAYLTSKGIPCKDYGCDSEESCDYPVYGKAAAEGVAAGACEKGIVFCTNGVGISIAANTVHGVRCALCTDPLAAEMVRKHNDSNMLALGGKTLGPLMAERIVDVFLSTEFEGGERHSRRVQEIIDMDV